MPREKFKALVNLDEPSVKRAAMGEVGSRRGWHVLTIEPKRPTRSLQQNAFYWTLCETFANDQREQGVAYTKALASVKLKYECGGLMDCDHDPLTGELLRSEFKSTADYSVPEMTAFLEQVIAYLLTEHGIDVGDQPRFPDSPAPAVSR